MPPWEDTKKIGKTNCCQILGHVVLRVLNPSTVVGMVQLIDESIAGEMNFLHVNSCLTLFLEMKLSV